MIILKKAGPTTTSSPLFNPKSLLNCQTQAKTYQPSTVVHQ